MTEITLSINGEEVSLDKEMTILEAAFKLGVEIPTLCHDPRLKPYGACRVCLVEVEGARAPLPACATNAADGMVVKTDTKEIHRLRKTVVELIISDHPLDCVTCEKCGNCALQDLAYKYDITESEFKGEKHSLEPQEDDPFIHRDLDKCILCGRCVRICDEVEHAFAIDFNYRGFKTQIGTTYGKSLKDTTCEFCGQCISTCPVGALIEKPRLDKGRLWELENTLTTCPYCGVGCTLELQTNNGEIVNVSAPLDIGVNGGNLCVKGRFGYDFVSSTERLKTPLIKKNGEFQEASWDEAIKLIAGRLSDIKKKHGPDSIAGLASAKCTNEENYIFQKFIRAAIGTNNVDHCARLCHSSTVAGLATAFGSGAMTNSISDFADSKAILIIGSNTSEAHPIIHIEILKAVRFKNAKLIVIDPREIKMSKFADISLHQRPGSDVAVLNGLMNVIIDEGLEDKNFIEERTEHFEALKKNVADYTPEKVEKISGIPADGLRSAARMYATSGASSIVYSMGITQHTTGTDNVLSTANLAMLTGNIGRPGTGVNPLRGQNNVQGACDMGSLPNVYSGYQKTDDESSRNKLEEAWNTDLPTNKGLTVVEVMNGGASGDVKGVYIMGENPMLSDPDVSHVEKALEKLDFLVVQDIFLTETAAFADVVLPSVSFAERDGTFTNTERRVQRIRKAVEPVGNAKEDWKTLCAVSMAMGYEMSYESADEILEEIASVTPSYGGITPDRLGQDGLQWPCPTSDHPGTPILHQEKFTRGLGKFHVVTYRPPAEEPDAEYPLILTTGRLLNQFHTGTMTRKTEGLDEIYPVAHVEISRFDAKKMDIKTGNFVNLETRRGKIKAKALVTDKSRKGVVFMPFHFKEAAANILTNPALDPIAKIPEFKVCALKISKAD